MIRAEYNRLFDLRLTILKALDRCVEIACIFYVNTFPEPSKLFEVALGKLAPSLTSGRSRFATAILVTLGQKHDIVSSSCKPRIVCRWPFAIASVEASADEVTANVNFIMYVRQFY